MSDLTFFLDPFTLHAIPVDLFIRFTVFMLSRMWFICIF